jgi:F420-dependent oxidoreductase-like protein
VAERTAAFIGVGRDLEASLERVRLAERLGYHSVWLNQLMGFDAMIAAAAYIPATSTIDIGTGVVPILPRHPAVMAMEAMSLDALSGGRFTLGIGVSHQVSMEGLYGLKLERPAALMREYLTIVKTLLRQGSVSHTGERYQVNFTFSGFKPLRPEQPTMIAALSARMLELAGELADGVVLWLCAPGYIRDVVVPRVRAGRERAGRTLEGFEIVAAVSCALTSDVNAARQVMRQSLVGYCNLPFYRKMLQASGFAADLERFDAQGPGGLSDEMLDQLAGLGDEHTVRGAVQRYRDAGATLPAVGALPSHDGYAGWEGTFRAAV